MSRFPCRTAIVGITFWLSLAHAAAADGPSVVASIKPLHSLVAGVMAELGNPVLLIEGGASPHTTALRPSDAASLQSADVVFWVGPELETFLEKPLHALPKQDNVVALHEADGVRLLPYRRGGFGRPIVTTAMTRPTRKGKPRATNTKNTPMLPPSTTKTGTTNMGMRTLVANSTCTFGSTRVTQAPWSSRSPRP